jgi:hypothetical protein
MIKNFNPCNQRRMSVGIITGTEMEDILRWINSLAVASSGFFSWENGVKENAIRNFFKQTKKRRLRVQ